MTEKGNGELHGTDLEELIGQLVGAHDEEHRRIAGELHDSTAQHLTAVLMGIDRACDLAARHDSFANVMGQARALVDQSLREITALCYRLHPPLFEELGLEPALHWLVRGFEECSGIAVSLEIPNGLGRLPHQMETALFRVAQTALADLRRYSGIASVELRIIRSRREVILLVKGRGLPKRRNSDGAEFMRGELDVGAMRARVQQMSGALHIHSEARGTELIMKIPFCGVHALM